MGGGAYVDLPASCSSVNEKMLDLTLFLNYPLPQILSQYQFFIDHTSKIIDQ